MVFPCVENQSIQQRLQQIEFSQSFADWSPEAVEVLRLADPVTAVWIVQNEPLSSEFHEDYLEILWDMDPIELADAIFDATMIHRTRP
jgi:hypothetical protein